MRTGASVGRPFSIAVYTFSTSALGMNVKTPGKFPGGFAPGAVCPLLCWPGPCPKTRIAIDDETRSATTLQTAFLNISVSYVGIRSDGARLEAASSVPIPMDRNYMQLCGRVHAQPAW